MPSSDGDLEINDLNSDSTHRENSAGCHDNRTQVAGEPESELNNCLQLIKVPEEFPSSAGTESLEYSNYVRYQLMKQLDKCILLLRTAINLTP